MEYNGKKYSVYSPEKLREIEFDYIFIAAAEQYICEILKVLKKLNIAEDKIRISDAINVAKFARINFIKTLSIMQTELGISANVAELGVWKGETARYINAYFKDRDFYLLDTFEGFDARDIKKEVELNTKSKVAQTVDFSDTSLECVKNVLPYPKKCYFIKGYFPQSSVQISENIQFKFVNLDVDLYQPILDGLKYFYPRLTGGGAVLIHDYFHPYYTGVKKAVDEYCLDNGITPIPIGDAFSVMIAKGLSWVKD